MHKWPTYFIGKRVWVTGASSGIGKAIVEALGAANVLTVASARRVEVLEQLAGQFESVTALPMDLSDFTTIGEKAMRAWDALGGIDVLINNAGMSQRSDFRETDPDVLRRIIDVNLTGPMLVTRAVVARMTAAGSGHVVAVTSAAVRVPTPLRSAYIASKLGLHGLFDSLRAEVGPLGIPVTLVVPGLVNTEVSEKAITAGGEEYGIKDANQANGMPADECAWRVLDGIASRRREFHVAMTPLLHFGMFMRRFLPRIYFKLISNVKVSGT